MNLRTPRPAHLLDKIGGPVRAHQQLDARERPPQDIERRREDDLAEAVRHSRLQIADRIGRFRRAGLELCHSSQHAPAMFKDMASESCQGRRLQRPEE